MRIAAVHRVDASDQFAVYLDCGCDFPVSEGMLTVADFACPLHEEYRFFGTPQPTPSPKNPWADLEAAGYPPLFDDDDWEEPH